MKFFSQKNIKIFFPFLGWIGELKKPAVLKADIIAGITVAMILVPQSIAYAKLAELPVTAGLYTAFIPVIIAALFGSSRQMSTGPVTIISLMTITALAPIATAGTIDYITYASLLAFLIGVFYLVLWALRGGIIVEFLSHPVIIGFTNAVALITIVSQLPKLFGIAKPEDYSNYVDYVLQMCIIIFHSTHLATMIIGILSLIGLVCLKKFVPKLPRILIIIIASIIIVAGLHQIPELSVALNRLSIVGEIQGALPSFSLPFMQEAIMSKSLGENTTNILHLAMYAIIIGLIGFTESMSVAKMVGTKTKQKINVNRELVGQGIANLSSGVFGGIGVSGSFSKTAVNLKAGAKTGFASIVTGSIVGITILFFLPLLYYLPIATLAAVIIIAVIDLIKFEPIRKARNIEKHDGIVGLTTFLLTLAFTPNIEIGILLGILLSLILYIYRSMRPPFVEVAMYQDGSYRDVKSFNLKGSKYISILRLDAPLFFANSSYFESQILNHIAAKKSIKYIILDMEWISDIDISGIETFAELLGDLHHFGTADVYLCNLRLKVITKLVKYKFTGEFPQSHIFPKIDNALDHIAKIDGNITKLKKITKYNPKKKKNNKNGQLVYSKYIEN